MTTMPTTTPATTKPIVAIFRLFAGAGGILNEAGSTGGKIAGTANALTDGELVVGDAVDDSVASDGTVTGSDLVAGIGMGAGVGLRIMRAALIDTV
jgi:hypothetical protein